MYIVIVGRPKTVLFDVIQLVMAILTAVVLQRNMSELVVYELQVRGITRTPK